MIGFRLQLKKLSDGRLVFTIPIGYKLLLLIIGLLILISLLVTRDEGGGSIFIRENTIPLIIAVISLLGAAYHECWIFDKAAGQVIHQNGLIAIHSNKVYRIEDLERIEISQFVKGKAGDSRTVKRSIGNRSMLTLSLHMKDGITHRVEIYRVSQKQHVEMAASIISEYCRIPFVIRE